MKGPPLQSRAERTKGHFLCVCCLITFLKAYKHIWRMAIQNDDGFMRLRHEDVEPFLPGRRGACKDGGYMLEDNLFNSMMEMREARRSDNSDTIPASQNVDEDAPEVPARGLSWRRKVGQGHAHIPIHRDDSWTGRKSASTKPGVETRQLVLPTPLNKFSSVDLQHQLVQLDVLEQELLSELRCARRDYDARISQLCSGHFNGSGPVTTLTQKSLLNMLPENIPHQHQPLWPAAAADASLYHTASPGPDPLAASSAVCIGAMPPPPPRPPRNLYVSQSLSQPQYSWQGRACKVSRSTPDDWYREAQ